MTSLIIEGVLIGHPEERLVDEGHGEGCEVCLEVVPLHDGDDVGPGDQPQRLVYVADGVNQDQAVGLRVLDKDEEELDGRLADEGVGGGDQLRVKI